LQPQAPPQQPPPDELMGASLVPEDHSRPAAAVTLISGIELVLSHAGQSASTLRCAMGRRISKTRVQSLQRYS